MDAPEHATRIMDLMSRLRHDERARLAFRWLDRSFRVHLVAALRRAGQGAAAGRLAGLGELRDLATCREAVRALIDVFGKDGCGSQLDTETLTPGAVLGATLSMHVRDDGPDIFYVVVGTATIAACVGAGAAEALAQIEDVESALQDPGSDASTTGAP